MNQDLEKKRIRELFSEMRREDGRRAPAFDLIQQAARDRLEKTGRPSRWIPVAIATATLVAIAGSLFILHRQESSRNDAPVIEKQDRANNHSPPPAAAPAASTTTATARKQLPKVARKELRQRRAPGRGLQSSLAVFSWRSPTRSLLKPLAEPPLKSVTRLNESIIGIDLLIPVSRN